MKIIIKKRTKVEKNAVLLAFFLFQYSLLIPLMSRFSPTLLVSLTGLVLLSFSFAINLHSKMNLAPLLVFGLVLVMLMIKMLMSGNMSHLLVYIAISGPPMFLLMNEFDEDEFIRTASFLALLNFAILFLKIFNEDINYMRFGYGMLLTVSIIFLKLFGWKCEKNECMTPFMLVFFVSFTELVLYAARGAILSFVILFFMNRFLIQKKRVLGNAVLLALVAFCVFNLRSLLDVGEQVANTIGVTSRPINKMRMLIDGGFAYASSGRTEIYEASLANIKKHFFFGGAVDLSTDDAYAHNLFLQVLEDFGIVGFILLLTALIAVIAYMCSEKYEKRKRVILLLFFSIGVGRLLFSSTLWRRPEFWMMLYYWAAQNKKWYIVMIGSHCGHTICCRKGTGRLEQEYCV